MRTRKPIIRGWALIAAAAIAFAQFALAAYACPRETVAAPQAMHAAMMDMEGCEQADAGTPPLCAKTCQDEPQKHETDSPAALPPSLDRGLRLETAYSGQPGRVVVTDPSLVRATSPPRIVLFARFLK